MVEKSIVIVSDDMRHEQDVEIGKEPSFTYLAYDKDLNVPNPK